MTPPRKTRRPVLRGAALTGLAAGALLLPTSAATADEPASTVPIASLVLTITPENPHPGNLPAQVTLECNPTGGTHPTAEDACKRLSAVNGDFEALPLLPLGCTDEWDPVTITATGTWATQIVEFKESHTNRGCAAADTDYVFAF